MALKIEVIPTDAELEALADAANDIDPELPISMVERYRVLDVDLLPGPRGARRPWLITIEAPNDSPVA
jgi:hypothetical protein